MMRRVTFLLALLPVLSCAETAARPLFRVSGKIAVLPVINRTDEALAVSGVGPVDRYLFQTGVITVSDILRAETCVDLEKSGFEVVPSRAVDAALKGETPGDPSSAAASAAKGGIEPLCLYLEIKRWDADVPMHPKNVVVAFAACLIDPVSRQVVWQMERRPTPVPTPGVVMMESAYVAAARRVAQDVVGGLTPDPSFRR
jgi:hypothetical protein